MTRTSDQNRRRCGAHQQEDVIVRGAPEEVHAHQRPALQVKRRRASSSIRWRNASSLHEDESITSSGREAARDVLKQDAVALLERRPQLGWRSTSFCSARWNAGKSSGDRIRDG